jgi:ribosomal protein L27
MPHGRQELGPYRDWLRPASVLITSIVKGTVLYPTAPVESGKSQTLYTAAREMREWKQNLEGRNTVQAVGAHNFCKTL